MSTEFIWHAEAIGAAIGLPRRSAYHLLENGLLPGTKVGAKWVVSRSRLLAAVSTPAAQRDEA